MSPSLDSVFLAELLDGDREFGAQLFQTFAEASEQWIREADDACQRGDVEQATRAFHTLKGSAASVGLIAVRDLARELETDARGGRMEVCAPRLGELSNLVSDGRALLANFLDSL